MRKSSLPRYTSKHQEAKCVDKQGDSPRFEVFRYCGRGKERFGVRRKQLVFNQYLKIGGRLQAKFCSL